MKLFTSWAIPEVHSRNHSEISLTDPNDSRKKVIIPNAGKNMGKPDNSYTAVRNMK